MCTIINGNIWEPFYGELHACHDPFGLTRRSPFSHLSLSNSALVEAGVERYKYLRGRERPVTAGMASRRRKKVEKMIDGIGISLSSFEALFKVPSDYYIFEIYDDSYLAMGEAIARVKTKFKPDRDGGFLTLNYLGCNDDHYEWYINNEGKRGALPKDAYQHFCRCKPDECPAKVGNEPIIHSRKWRGLGRDEANDILRDWGRRGLPPEAMERTPSPRRKSPEPERKRALAPATSAKARPEDKRRRFEGGGLAVDEMVEEEESPEPAEAPKTRKEALNASRGEAKSSAIDMVLEGGLRSGTSKELDDRLNALRTKLSGRSKGGEAKSRKPGGILASRAAEAAGKEKKHKKRRSAIGELAKALQPKKRKRDEESDDSSSSSGGPGYDEVRDSGDGQGGWQSKRRRYKKIADESPGKLMMMALEDMQEHLGAYVGEALNDDQKLNPVVTRYLMSVIVPTLGGKTIGPDRMREMRTLALGVDLLLKGCPESAGDVFLQRFKSLAMQVRDGSSQFGPQIELLPEDVFGTGASNTETEFAREIAYKEARSEELLKKAARGDASGSKPR